MWVCACACEIERERGEREERESERARGDILKYEAELKNIRERIRERESI